MQMKRPLMRVPGQPRPDAVSTMNNETVHLIPRPGRVGRQGDSDRTMRPGKIVTGGAGLIGSNLCDALSAAATRVRGWMILHRAARQPSRRHRADRGDVADTAKALRVTARIEGAFNLAAIACRARDQRAWQASHH